MSTVDSMASISVVSTQLQILKRVHSICLLGSVLRKCPQRMTVETSTRTICTIRVPTSKSSRSAAHKVKKLSQSSVRLVMLFWFNLKIWLTRQERVIMASSSFNTFKFLVVETVVMFLFSITLFKMSPGSQMVNNLSQLREISLLLQPSMIKTVTHYLSLANVSETRLGCAHSLRLS